MVFVLRPRSLADLLTISRVFLGVVLVVLGATRGGPALSLAAAVVIVAWLTDVLDGPLARRDPDPRPTCVGRHDAEADLAVSLGVAIYLTTSGFMPLWIGTSLALLIVGPWAIHSHQLAWPFYAIPYLILGALVLHENPRLGWLGLGFLLTMGFVGR